MEKCGIHDSVLKHCIMDITLLYLYCTIFFKNFANWKKTVQSKNELWENKGKKKVMPIINESQFEKPGVNVLPQSKKEPEVNQSDSNLTQSKIDFQLLKFT
mgnify:CR=1 FL=1